ncbi:DamX protein [Kosakonia oryzendophytica]|uniref:Cell division protein DamX n=1 Tax=Kosakonia oryzendophytica TaxID=1005665 RepID=A0A1C4E9B4_9ENTR|nr:cell division protein DamX [Kosakonia oryzendophytica]SCC40111.1 DamX protein [Kosakonia oryzendophytica]
MDEFKPEDELKPDPSDRRAGRSRQSSDRVDEPQINFDDVDLDTDDRRPSRTRRAREEEGYDEDEGALDEEREERRPRKRKTAAAARPASRQYMMMGVGILVLLLLIIGIGSALKSPAPSTTEQAPTEKNIDLSANNGNASAPGAAEQTNGAQPAPGAASAPQTAGNPSQDVSLPPISSTPSQGQTSTAPEGQQRVEVQGDLNSALSQPQNLSQIDSAVNSTLPTEPATVAPVRNGNAAARQQSTAENHTAASRPERKQMVIEPKPQAKAPAVTAESKPVAQPPKRTETVTTAPVKAPSATPVQPKPAATAAAPVVTAPAASAAPAASGAASTGNVAALKAAPGSHYTLQLSSSSNSTNLNAWAKKENLKNFVVYQTTRNGQPWYVLVSGVYASKDDAKRAVAALPADVQAKNPWAKPLHQVQADLK